MLLRSWGYKTIAHPWTFTGGRDAAVMVSGNAMAQIYLELDRKTRPWWPELEDRWSELVQSLLARESVDVLALPHSRTSIEVRAPRRGAALIVQDRERYSYRPIDGDPFGIGEHEGLTDIEAHEVTADCDYPDGIVQLALLGGAHRSGEIILSATRGWDFRSRYEPIPHVSSHGAMHREHMLVPLLMNRRPRRTPLRTVDVMPSALAVLGEPIPGGLDGVSFL
jgi:hypothetical protein